MLGGAVLNSGTYGCILKPAIPCKGETSRKPDYVSKLMTLKDANNEYSEIIAIKDKVKSIHDNNMYYIISDIRLCEIGNITSHDLDNFYKNCGAMKRRKYKKEDILNSRVNNNLRLLQLPDGGKDVTYYFNNDIFSVDIFPKINTALIRLLKYGIAPLKDVGVLHQDIKGDNVVYSEEKNLARLIDWGLATVLKGSNVPNLVKYWPILFNQPLTNSVLHTNVQELYKIILQRTPQIQRIINGYQGDNLIDDLTPVISHVLKNNYMSDYKTIDINISGLGHIKYIITILEECGNFDATFNVSTKKTAFDAFAHLLSLQITKALLHFSIKDNKIHKFDESLYFNTVFKHNCDIFGFLACYVDIFMNKKAPVTLRGKIYQTVLKPFYFNDKYAYTPYDVDEISKACLELNSDYEKKVPEPKQNSGSVKRKQLMIISDSNRDNDPFILTLKKRCPKGSRCDKKTKKCVKKITKNIKPKPKPGISWPLTQRCPKGSRRDKKTKKCVKKSNDHNMDYHL